MNSVGFSFGNVIWLVFLLAMFIPLLQRKILEMRRIKLMEKIERSRQSRVITMIHRQESVSFLGIPIARYIDIDDSERVLRAIRFTPPEMPIDIILHTPGGLVLAAEQIAYALKRHKGKITVFVPHFAMSGGTLIALAADEILMDPNAVLGPVDPQIGDAQHGAFPARSILTALAQPNPNREDHILILGDIAKKAIQQVHTVVLELIRGNMDHSKAEEVAQTLSEGRWTHDFPIMAKEANELGLPIAEGLPKEVYDLMDLYPQPTQRRLSVEFIPVPYRPTRPIPSPAKGRGSREEV